MISNYDLMGVRSNIPVTQVQVFPKFFYEHEVFAIKKMSEQFPEEDGTTISSHGSDNVTSRNSKLRWLVWNDEI